jgi:holo-[acyl-carrier protein] synthase
VPRADTAGEVAADLQYRVGTDLVETRVIEEAVEQFGDRYLKRVFTNAEAEYCRSSAAQFVQRLAARFAAKEATLKVLRPDGAWPSWQNIEVVRHASGWCDIKLHGSAAALALQNRCSIVSCSLSHEGQYAIAVVLGVAHAS